MLYVYYSFIQLYIRCHVDIFLTTEFHIIIYVNPSQFLTRLTSDLFQAIFKFTQYPLLLCSTWSMLACSKQLIFRILLLLISIILWCHRSKGFFLFSTYSIVVTLLLVIFLIVIISTSLRWCLHDEQLPSFSASIIIMPSLSQIWQLSLSKITLFCLQATAVLIVRASLTIFAALCKCWTCLSSP